MQTTATQQPSDMAAVPHIFLPSTITTRTAWSDDVQGFSGSYLWWRHHTRPGKWSVLAFESDLGFSNNGIAVTDDFGNLARVPA